MKGTLMTDKTSPVRHAVARSTGATTWTRQDGDTWRSTCLNHGAETTAPNRGKARVTGSQPQNFCAKCKYIAAGKLAKITRPRLDLPAPTAKKAATAKKAPTTPATTKAAK